MGNHISAIQFPFSADHWRQVDTADNPADVASQGQILDQHSHSEIRFNVYAFLWLQEAKWPTNLVKWNVSRFESSTLNYLCVTKFH